MIAQPRAKDDMLSYLTSCPLFFSLSNIKECWAKQSQSSSIFLSAPHEALSSSHACLLCLPRNMAGLLKFNQETRFYLCLCCWPCLRSHDGRSPNNVLFLNDSFERLPCLGTSVISGVSRLSISALRFVMSNDAMFILDIFWFHLRGLKLELN